MYAIKCPYGISVPTANITDHLDSKKGYECTRIGETIQLTLQYNMFLLGERYNHTGPACLIFVSVFVYCILLY